MFTIDCRCRPCKAHWAGTLPGKADEMIRHFREAHSDPGCRPEITVNGKARDVSLPLFNQET